MFQEKEADNAEIGVIHKEITQFSLEWLTVQLDAYRMVTDTNSEPIKLRDLVLRIFSDLLPHTPIRAMGINRNLHFNLHSQQRRDKIGFALAPASAWGEREKSITQNYPDGHHGGMLSLTMQEFPDDGRPGGHVQAKAEPSTQIKNNCGVYN